MRFLTILWIASFSIILTSFSTENESSTRMLSTVNKLRAKGCFCGKEYMPPVRPVKWNKVLYQSAYDHAKDMSRYNYFSHYNSKGLSIGKRIDQYDYPWRYVGENIGEGQKTFREVFIDWKNSKSHCKMMMNPKMKEMAVARYDRFWVQHFGAKKRKDQ